MQIRGSGIRSVFFSLVLFVFLVLTIGTVNRLGISWDEQTDLDISHSYQEQPNGWWVGSDSDPINVRLPMYTVAIAGTLFGHTNLIFARLISIAVAVAVLVFVYKYSKRYFGELQAMVAICVLGSSPYFLSHARVALTESDIFVCCGTMLLLLITARTASTGCSVGNALLLGGALGICLAAKISSVALIPASVLFAVWPHHKLRPTGSGLTSENSVGVQFFMIGVILVNIIYGWLHSKDTNFRHLLHYMLMMSLATFVLWHAYGIRHQYHGRILSAALILSMAAITFMLVPPVHTYNPTILKALASGRDNLANFKNGFFVEAGALHFLTTLLHPGVVIGSFLWLSMIRAAFRLRTQANLRLPLAFFISYFVFLCTLPDGQPFYMMPMFPLMAILAGDWLTSIWGQHKQIARGVIGLCVLNVCVDLTLCFPDYNLNGYQILGERYIGGRSSVGYRCVVQTPSDGLQQALEYVNQHATSTDAVLIYDGAKHIVHATCPSPEFRILDGAYGDGKDREATYVVTTIGDRIEECWGPDWPTGESIEHPVYDADYLESHFQPVFVVRRRFGILMAMVWRRNPDSG